MSGKSDYLEGKILDDLFGIAAFTPPDPFYVALFTAAPNDAGGGTEVSLADWDNYARASVAAGAAQWTRTANAIANDAAISFGTANIVGSDPTVSHFGVFDAVTAGNLLYWGALAASKVIQDGDPVEIPAGDLDITED